MGTQGSSPSLYPVLTCSVLHLPRDKLQKNKAFLALKEPVTSVFGTLVLCLQLARSCTSLPSLKCQRAHSWHQCKMLGESPHRVVAWKSPPGTPSTKLRNTRTQEAEFYGECPLSYTLRSALEETGQMPASADGG